MNYNTIHDKHTHAEIKGHDKHPEKRHDHHHDHHRGNKVFAWIMLLCILTVLTFGIFIYIYFK